MNVVVGPSRSTDAALVLVATAIAVLCLSACGGSGGSSTGQVSSSGTSGASEPDEGGEKSIEEFGSEATGSSRAALLTAFRNYMGAIAARDYAEACSYLAEQAKRSLVRLLGKRGRVLGCDGALPRLLSPAAATVAGEQEKGKVTKVRVAGDRAFIVYQAPGAKLYQLPMHREGGSWKAETAVGSVLVPSPAIFDR